MVQLYFGSVILKVTKISVLVAGHLQFYRIEGTSSKDHMECNANRGKNDTLFKVSSHHKGTGPCNKLQGQVLSSEIAIFATKSSSRD